jgi:hypothetical protein
MPLVDLQALLTPVPLVVVDLPTRLAAATASATCDIDAMLKGFERLSREVSR